MTNGFESFFPHRSQNVWIASLQNPPSAGDAVSLKGDDFWECFLYLQSAGFLPGMNILSIKRMCQCMKNSAPYCQNLSSAMLISQLFSFYLTSLIEYIYIYPRILSVSLNYILCSEEDLQILLTKKLKFWLKRMACVRSRHACNSCEEWGTILSTTEAIMHSRYDPSTIISLIH